MSEVLEYMVKTWGEIASLEGLLRFKVGGIEQERMNGDFDWFLREIMFVWWGGGVVGCDSAVAG